LSNIILTYREHEQNTEVSEKVNPTVSEVIFKRKRENGTCFRLHKDLQDKIILNTNYYVGIDWINKSDTALLIKPKLDDDNTEIDVLGILWQVAQHSEVANYIGELYTIKWDQPSIEIQKHEDTLSPLLMVEYLLLLRVIVKKGLKSGYNKREENLNSRIKGKFNISKTLKQNRVKGKVLHTFCSYDEFGINHPENRLLKQALGVVKAQLGSYKLSSGKHFESLISYVSPAFERVNVHSRLDKVNNKKQNVFYKEYEKATDLAHTILKRFGYNATSKGEHLIKTPPYWIDMSILFELYVLSLLKDRFKNDVEYHTTTFGNELDYLLNSSEYKMVIDSKYKQRYATSKDHLDMRQVSGYARLTKIYELLDKNKTANIDCLIFYPLQSGFTSLEDVDLRQNTIKQYEGIYRVGVRLPVVS